MATTTTLGFSILSRYSGHGVTQARRDLAALRAQMSTINGDLQRHTSILNGIPQRWKAIGVAAAAVGPAMIPIGAVALQTAGAFTVMATSIGASLGAYIAAMKGAISQTMEMAKAGKALSPVQKEYVGAVEGMRKAWANFIKETSGQTLATATNAVQGLTAGIKLLKPLIDAIHPSMLLITKDFESWMKGDKAAHYASVIAGIAKITMPMLVQAGKNVLNVLGDGFRALAPLADDVAAAILRGSKALREWSDGGGFQRFLQYVRDNKEATTGFFHAFGAALVNVRNILSQFADGSLAVLTDALRAIAAINPESMKAFANALLLIKSPLLWLVLNCPPLRDAMIGLISAMNPQIIYAVAAAFVVLRVAFMLMNTALLTTPLGWLILGLVALGAAIVVIATKTTWFQTAWTYTWNFIKAVASAVWQALQVAWSAFIGAMQTAWSAVSGALVGAWNAVWNGMSTAVRAVWGALQTAWNAFTGALATVWTAVSTALVAAWNAVWNGLKTAAEAVWNALKTAWNAFILGVQLIWTTVSSALSAAWSAVWNAIKAAAEAVWNALKAAWNFFLTAIKTAWNTVAEAMKLSWGLVWNAIKTAAEFVWNLLKTAWNFFLTAIKTAWNTVAEALKMSWSLVWNAIKTAAETIWNFIKGLWDGLLKGLGELWDKFSAWIKEKWNEVWNSLKDSANKVWHLIGEIIEKAINGVIGLVNGLIKGFNKITSFLKIDVSVSEIPKVNLNFAEGGMVGLTPYMNGGISEFSKGGAVNLKGGGTLRGYAPGRDTIPAVLSKGEGVLTPEAVRGMGGPGFVHAANRRWAGHRGAGKQARAPLSRYTGSHDWTPQSRGGSLGHRRPRHFADGGMVGAQHFAVGGMTAAALARAGVSTGLVSQGEYSNGSLSAGTHMGGGVVDLSTTSTAVLLALRSNGFAAWIRGAAEGMAPHIHAVLMNHPDLSGPARAQVAEFLAGGDGLGAGGGSGGGVDIMGMLAPHIGKILKNVYRGMDALTGIGGDVASFFGAGGNGKEDDGGLFGTGIGPDVGPDIPVVSDLVGDLADTGAGNAAKAMEAATGMMGLLGQIVLSMLDQGSIKEGLSDAKFPGEGGIAEIAAGFGKKLLNVVLPDFLMKEKEKAPPIDFSAFGGGGNVGMWAGLAMSALLRAGLSGSQLGAFLALMQAESGGNPLAINNWDSNAAMGQASRGLMQVIPSTFAAYRDPSLPNNIFDPLANMTAAARYIKARYGGNVPGSPYALGTPGATSGVHLVGEQGPELLNFRGGESVTPAGETASVLGGGEGGAGGEEFLAQYQLLAQKAQEMATRIQTAWMQVSTSGQTARSAMAPVFAELATQFGVTIPTAMAAMATANTTHWLAMQTGTTTAWTAMRDGTYTEAGDHMSVKMPTWASEMNGAVSESWFNMGEATATAWEGMKEGTRGPTNWIIENSYNNGLARLWNEVASVIFEDGAKQLPTVQALAKGGPVRGCGSETGDRVPAMLSRGEHVWTAREVHRAGGHHAVQAMRSGVMGGGKVRGAHRGRGFALGGWLGGVGTIGSGLSLPSLGELKRGSMMEEAEPFLDALDSGVRGALAGSPFRKMGAVAGALSPSDWMRQYIEKDDELNKIGSGGPPWIPGVSDAITSWGGVTVNQRTADMLNMAMGLGASFSASQGSFSSGVAASAGTHDGGGVVDLVPANNTNVGALRAVGFAAWNRGAAWGSPSFSDHIHAVALGDPTVSAGAAAQVMSYLAGGNGLADGGPDNFSGGIPGGVEGVTSPGGGREVDPADLEQRTASFDRGGFLQPGWTLAHNGTGKPEPVGHHLVPRGSGGVQVSMPVTITGAANAQEVVDGINSQVLPKLRQFLTKGTGNNG